jgi:hypothetical protein
MERLGLLFNDAVYTGMDLCPVRMFVRVTLPEREGWHNTIHQKLVVDFIL